MPTSTPLAAADLILLANLVTGPVFGPDEPGAVTELAGANSAPEHRPLAVIGVASPSDVQIAVSWSAARELPVAVHATGHSGSSYRGTVVLTTSRLSAIQVDPTRRIARVGAGVTWGHVVEAAAIHGLAPLNGSSPTVGVVGYTLGGGVGVMARKFGFAADHVRSLDLVTADGRHRFVDATHDADLFWAIRGGKGNFGVVTAIEFDLFPVSTITGGSLFFTPTDGERVLRAFPEWCAGLPPAATVSIALISTPPSASLPEPIRAQRLVQLRFAHLGPSDDAQRSLEPIRAAASPVLDTVDDIPYSRNGEIFNDPTTVAPTMSTGVFLSELTPAAIDALLDSYAAAGDLPLVLVELRALGGAMARQARHPNAVGGRDATYLLGVVGLVPPPLRDPVRAAVAAVADALSPWSTGVVPVNYRAALEPGEAAGTAWSPAIHRRLRQVKAIYDPHNMFRAGYPVIPETTIHP